MSIDNQAPLPTPAEPGDNGDGNNAPPPDVPPPDAPADAPAASINVKFTDNKSSDVHFKMKATTRLGKAMTAYAERNGRQRNALRFLFEGERVLDDTTPADLDLQDGDAIEVHEEQIGGCSI